MPLASAGLLCAIFAVFFVLPFAGLIERGLGEDGAWKAISSDTALDALVLSLWTSTLSLLIAIVAGTPVAYWLSHTRFPGKGVLEALIDLPIVLPPTIAGVALLTAFGRKGLLGGPLDDWFGLTLGFSTAAVIMAQLFVSAPFYVRAARAGFASVDAQFERVAHTLGASRLRAFTQIVLPLSWPSLAAGAALCWARALGELGATLIFAGNLQGETQTMPLAILNTFESAEGLTAAVALAILLLAVALVALAIFWMFSSRARGTA
ncbi:MAG: molybdate ABC transporter permease subunit [Dehalococcoidia bacterium]|nr:molybdate ABC transporter permease subunit [Dehalococcoidia bacterium]